MNAQISTSRVSESDAARAAISGTRRERLRIAAGALFRLMRDPDDTRQVFLLGIVANGPSFPGFFLKFASTADGQRLLAERPTIDGKVVERLRALPADTLGGAYARYLDGNGLDADLFQAPPGLPDPIGYLAQRMRQTHDIWHVLTGCAPDVPGEIALQAFTYGQMGMPSAGLIALFGTLRFGLRHRRLARDVVRGVAHGRRARFLATVVFEDRWARPLGEVRRELGVVPLAA